MTEPTNTDFDGFLPDDDMPRDPFPTWAKVFLCLSLACSAANLSILIGLILGERP